MHTEYERAHCRICFFDESIRSSLNVVTQLPNDRETSSFLHTLPRVFQDLFII